MTAPDDIKTELIELRAEFRNHAQNMTATLAQMAKAMDKLTELEVKNAARDAREASRDEKIKALETEVKAHGAKLTWYAGALAALGVVWQLLSKKLGL